MKNIILLKRKECNLSQAELAKRIGVSQKAIDFWEKGENEPKASYLIALGDYFGCSVDELLGRESFETGAIEIRGVLLTEVESDLVSLFRKLSTKEQYRALGIIQGLAS